MKPVILVMAGGTGGHIFPALAIAHQFQTRGYEVHWLGSKAGMETVRVPKAGFPLHTLSVRGLRGQGLLRLLKAPWLLTKAVWESLKLIKQLNPVLVIGFGGFASGPGGLAARILNVPLAIHEQNAVAGFTNRCLSRWARPVMQAFPGAIKQAEVVGNPIRNDLIQLPRPEDRWQHRHGPIRLLVLGGSLGAQALNESIPQALKSLPETERPEVWHQCGEKHLNAAEAAYQSAQVHASVVSFIEDMAQALSWADLVICRAGALTVSEVAAVGVPALFVPYPYAVDDHQTKNAQWLVNAGAAHIIQQSDLTPGRLAEWLKEHAASRDGLLVRAQKAHELAKPKSTEQVLELCLQRISS